MMMMIIMMMVHLIYLDLKFICKLILKIRILIDKINLLNY